MTKLVRILALALGLGLLAAVLGMTTSTPAPAAGSAPVNIAAVSVPSVPVSGTVSVGNTPSVNVANTPTVNLGSRTRVNVSNPPDSQNNPTPLTTLDASQPYEDNCVIDIGGQVIGSCSFQPIPSRKRLVIQEVDGNLLGSPPGFKLLKMQLVGTGNGNGFHFFIPTFLGTEVVIPADWFAMHQETRLYASANATLQCNVTLTLAPQSASAVCAFSGFLVDVP